jgi:DNA polymerase-3 subunit alpha
MVYGQALDTVSRRNRAQIAGQQDLFSNGNDNGNEIALVIDYPDMEEFPRAGLLLMEKETAGIYLSGHPMLDYSEAKEHIGAVDIAEIFASFGDDGTGRFSEHDRVNIMGMISSKKLKVTKNEQQMAFVELEDMTGSIELIVFPNVYEQMASRLREDAVIAVSGEISVKEVASGEEMKIEPKLILRTVLPIEPNGENQPTAKTVPQPQRPVLQRPQNTAAQSGMTDCLYLKVPSEQSYEFERIKSLLDIFSGGNMPVFVYFDDTKTLVRSKTPVMLNDTAYDLAGSILGRENVVIKAKKL